MLYWSAELPGRNEKTRLKDLPMKISLFAFIALVLVAASALVYAQTTKHNYVPSAGYVPNANTATRIAVAVWSPIYGEKQIEGEKPFRAKLVKGVWIVEGSLPGNYSPGGVAIAEISKQDGRILRVSHGK